MLAPPLPNNEIEDQAKEKAAGKPKANHDGDGHDRREENEANRNGEEELPPLLGARESTRERVAHRQGAFRTHRLFGLAVEIEATGPAFKVCITLCLAGGMPHLSAAVAACTIALVACEAAVAAAAGVCVTLCLATGSIP